MAERLSPFEKSLALLMTIPGIARRSATILISELVLALDMVDKSISPPQTNVGLDFGL